MTQKTSVHAHGEVAPSPEGAGTCKPFVVATGIMSAFSDFDVTETGTEMPCYCAQWNVDDRINGAKFQAEVEERRTSHNLKTTLASHTLHYKLVRKDGLVLIDRRTPVGVTAAGRTQGDFTLPFGKANQDTIAFYMSNFPDPRGIQFQQKKIVTFFWYQNVGGGTVLDPDPAVIIATGSCLIYNSWFPNLTGAPWGFQPTDLNFDAVAIEGNVDFGSGFSTIVTLGEQPHTTGGLTVAASLNTSPCATSYATETSNAVSDILNVENSLAGGGINSVEVHTHI